MKKILLDIDDWISFAEAARIRNTTRQAISKLVKRGRLEPLSIGGHVFVKKSSVLSFTEALPGRKRANKK